MTAQIFTEPDLFAVLGVSEKARSSEKQKQHDYRTHATSGLEVSCGLRLATVNEKMLMRIYTFDSLFYSGN